ncbi:MAG TPA: cation diffusion facilitator family transporter [Burkholderiales bacterium]|nr:cation diffusion facilitator family transporter [Burkholderiales bacterium]
MSADGSLRAVLYALSANFGIFLAKAVAAWVTGSASMLAEAIHSFADCGNQGLLLRGMREAQRAPSREHPLGHGMVVYFWAFLVAVLLFTVGGAFSIYEGAHKLSDPQLLSWPGAAIAVLLIAIVLESFSLAGCLREIRKVAHGRSLWRFFRQSRNSELIVILGEDVAALAGLLVALGAVLLSLLTGNPVFDAVGSILVGMLLILVAVLLAIEIKALITGQSADPEVEEQIRRFVTSRPEVAELFNLITLQLGDAILLAVKARMRESLDAGRLMGDVNLLESDLRRAFPQIQWLFFEPDDRP